MVWLGCVVLDCDSGSHGVYAVSIVFFWGGYERRSFPRASPRGHSNLEATAPIVDEVHTKDRPEVVVVFACIL